MSALALPTRPDNLRAPARVLIESDVFRICDRIKEIDPNLYIYALTPPVKVFGSLKPFSLCEMCADGVERFVMYVEALDARIIERLQYILHVPYEQRYAEAERLEAKDEEDRKQEQLDQLYEHMGQPMWTDLERCGFIQRSVSYPKAGVVGGRGSLKR